MTNKLITNTTELGKSITSALKTYASVGLRLHVLTISALHHAAVHGDPIYINRIYAGLRTNDQTALRMFIRRSHAIVGLDGGAVDGLDSDVLNAAIEAGTVLTFTKGEFSVAPGATEARKVFAELCSKRFLNPDGETDRHIFDRNNLSEVKTLGDTQVLDQLIKLADSLTPTEKRKVNVSDSVRAFLASIKDKAEAYKTQGTLAQG